MYGAVGAGGLVFSGEVAIASLPSAAGSLSGCVTAGQRVFAFCGPHGSCSVAPELPKSHHTFPSNSNELPLSPEFIP